MIDEDVVMADNSPASSNDDDFDVSKKDVCVCVILHVSCSKQRLQGRQQSLKSNIPLPPFMLLLSSLSHPLPPSFWQQA